MQRTDFAYFYLLRVRYAEVDAQGVVFNAHYLTYFDTAITEFMRASGFNYKELFTTRGLDFHLIKATVEFLKPIGFDRLIEVGVRVGRIGRSSVAFDLGIFEKDDHTCLARGEIIWVCAQVGTHKSHPLPEDFVAMVSV